MHWMSNSIGEETVLKGRSAMDNDICVLIFLPEGMAAEAIESFETEDEANEAQKRANKEHSIENPEDSQTYYWMQAPLPKGKILVDG